jgi:hypothetical protein
MTHSGACSFSVAPGNDYKFTGKERDSESGLDEFGARYYAICDGTFHDSGLGCENQHLAGIGRQDQDTSVGQIGAAVGDFVATVQGGVEVLAGGPAQAGGVVACGSGVGCLVTAPAVVAGTAAEVHGAATATEGVGHLLSKALANTKDGGARTEPSLPSRTVVKEGGVEITHNYRGNDHGPAHLHVDGEGPSTRTGMNGKPLRGNPELSAAQRNVVQDNKSVIRNAVDRIQRWFSFNNQ